MGIENSEKNPHIYRQLLSARMPRPFNGVSVVFITNGIGTTGYSQAKEFELLPHRVWKNKLKIGQGHKDESQNYKTSNTFRRKHYV